MGGVYLGLLSERDYLFVTNDKFGSTEREGAIIRVNNFCGALIVTAKGRFLIRLREVLDRSLSNINQSEEGISIDLARAIVESLEQEFQREPHFRQNPLPFLLLLVGCRAKEFSSFEHIFIRNRVVDIIDKYGEKEYITRSEIQPPVAAEHLFYGHSELPEYLLRQIAPSNLNPGAMRVLAYLALSETQKIDDSLFPEILMATVSRENGFEWIKEEELYRLSGLAQTVDRTLMVKLSGFFTPLESPTIYGGGDKNK